MPENQAVEIGWQMFKDLAGPTYIGNQHLKNPQKIRAEIRHKIRPEIRSEIRLKIRLT